jgi:hypothetical protein
MAFVPETGDIVPNANSYVTVAEADSFHADRGNTAWAATDTSMKQAALIKATDYIEQKYDGKWKGEPVVPHQSLSWPRENVPTVSSDEIPAKLKQAVCILALEAITEDLNPTLARGGLVKREKVDVIEVEYMDGASGQTTRPAIDGLLRGLLSLSSGINRKVVRV